MGIVFVEAAVANKNKHKDISILVDSGATYSLLAKNIWQELGLKPKREMEFILADGTKIKRSISECLLKLPIVNSEAHTPVILGEENDNESLLGAVTLEIFGLILDPLSRTIREIKGMIL